MYTRCQACHTVHPLNAEMLAQGNGKFRCSKCKKVGNALDALFDQWPDASEKGTPPGTIPELGIPLTLPAKGEDFDGAEDEALPGSIGKRRSKPMNPWLRATWITVGLVLGLVITLQLAIFFKWPILQEPALQPMLIALGINEKSVSPLRRNTGQIELLSKEMKTHPSRPGVLLLTATIINRSSNRQTYPDVDVTLLDIRGRRLQRKLFKPGDYLSRTSELRSGLAPEGFLTFSLEMLDPGDKAQGFEVQFR